MAVEIYLGRLFRHGHERRAFGRFVKDLYNLAKDTDELYFVVGEVDANAAAMDLLLLAPRSIIIVDLKELTAAEEKDAHDIHLSGTENGPWCYTVPGNSTPIRIKRKAGKDPNPYKQVERMRYKLAEWLVEHSKSITGENWSEAEALDRTHAWLAFSPGFDGNTDDLDLPWPQIRKKHRWFQVVSIHDLAWEFHCTTNLHHEFTERQLRECITQLGATRLEHPGQVFPDYFPDDLPPAPRSFLFTTPVEIKNLIDRETELDDLTSMLLDPRVSMVCVKGMAGIGKTYLVGAVIPGLVAHGWQVRWVDCREKELNLESFLAAVAAETKDRVKAKLILEKDEVKLVDRLDAALDYLESEGIILIFDDFHKVADPHDLDPLFIRVLTRTERLKIILVSREHPEFFYNAICPPGTVKAKTLPELDKQYIQAFYAEDGFENLGPEEISVVWDRTHGNPYAMGLLRPLVNKFGWGEQVSGLSLYKNDQNQWFDSLMDTIGVDARQLAQKLSAVRSGITQGLIDFLEHDPRRAMLLTVELKENFFIQPGEQPGTYRIHEFLREYLYDNLQGPKRNKAHQDSGKYYRRVAEQSMDDFATADALFEAIFHFEQSDGPKEIHELAPQAYELLYLHGDWTRAYQVAQQALKASRSLKDTKGIANWLVRIAGWESDHDKVKEASLHLQQALDQLPKPGEKSSEGDVHAYQTTLAQIYIQKARLAYYVTDYERASEHLTQALALAKKSGHEALYADCMMRIGRIERQRGNFEVAHGHFEEVREIALRLNDKQTLVQALSHLALIARQQGNLDDACRLFSQAYEIAKEAGDLRGMEINRSLLADLARRQKNYQEAAEIFRECLDISRQIGNAVGIRINLGQLAESLTFLGELDEAEQLLDEAQKRCESASDGIGLAWTWRRKGLILKKRGDVIEGNNLIRKGVMKLIEVGSEVYIAEFERDLGDGQLRLL